MTYGCVRSWILFISVWILILHQNPVSSIPRSNSTPDANQMRRTGYKNEFSVLCTRRLVASTSLSAKRTLPSFCASWIFILHQKPSFFDPAVELDAGREPNAAHRIQKRILRPLHPPARGLDLPFGQTNAPQLFRTSLIFILHQKPRFFSIPRSNPTPDANQMRRTVYKNEFSVLGTRRLAASTSRSSKRTPPSFRVLCLMNIQKLSFSDPAVEPDVGREPNAAHRIQKRILRPLHPPARGLDLPFGQTNAPQLFRTSLIFILHQKPRVFSIPRSNPTQDTNQMRHTVYKNKFSVLGTRRLAASTSRSSKRTPPSFRVLCLMNIQKPSFFDPAVELDAGREPDAAHRMQKRIPRPRRRPPRGLDLPFGQANAPHFRLIKSDAQQRVWTPHVALAYYYRDSSLDLFIFCTLNHLDIRLNCAITK